MSSNPPLNHRVIKSFGVGSLPCKDPDLIRLDWSKIYPGIEGDDRHVFKQDDVLVIYEDETMCRMHPDHVYKFGNGPTSIQIKFLLHEGYIRPPSQQ